MNGQKDNEPGRALGSRRPPDYVVVVAASDWVNDRSRVPGPTSGTPCKPARTATANPNPI
jgi:hypothetical protein